jgi:hypothetical protein
MSEPQTTRESDSGQSPLITDRHGERFDSYDEAVKAIASVLSHGGRTWFRYHHYSAFTINVSHHSARIYAVSIGYTGRERESASTIWRPEVDHPKDVAVACEIPRGHDTDTLAVLFGALGDAMVARWTRSAS